LRESKCFNYEGNFMYLLLGRHRAILFGTGTGPSTRTHGAVLPLRRTVDDIIRSWCETNAVSTIDLLVAHTHSHLDHVFWDSQFRSRPRTTVVGQHLADVKAFFRLPLWPDGESAVDLGNRTLTVFPLPGHEETHIAVYDDRTNVFLTGDTLYPGLLTVRDWPAFRRSATRLAAFAAQHPISWVLGDHIEMKRTPRELYPIGTTYQPDERALPLTVRHIRELHEACEAMAHAPRRAVHDDFIIDAG
jgi:glyoxylase-like metal-dependent hydrolase (beta-lactamase superfamily II)